MQRLAAFPPRGQGLRIRPLPQASTSTHGQRADGAARPDCWHAGEASRVGSSVVVCASVRARVRSWPRAFVRVCVRAGFKAALACGIGGKSSGIPGEPRGSEQIDPLLYCDYYIVLFVIIVLISFLLFVVL